MTASYPLGVNQPRGLQIRNSDNSFQKSRRKINLIWPTFGRLLVPSKDLVVRGWPLSPCLVADFLPVLLVRRGSRSFYIFSITLDVIVFKFYYLEEVLFRIISHNCIKNKYNWYMVIMINLIRIITIGMVVIVIVNSV